MEFLYRTTEGKYVKQVATYDLDPDRMFVLVDEAAQATKYEESSYLALTKGLVYKYYSPDHVCKVMVPGTFPIISSESKLSVDNDMATMQIDLGGGFVLTGLKCVTVAFNAWMLRCSSQDFIVQSKSGDFRSQAALTIEEIGTVPGTRAVLLQVWESTLDGYQIDDPYTVELPIPLGDESIDLYFLLLNAHRSAQQKSD